MMIGQNITVIGNNKPGTHGPRWTRILLFLLFLALFKKVAKCFGNLTLRNLLSLLFTPLTDRVDFNNSGGNIFNKTGKIR